MSFESDKSDSYFTQGVWCRCFNRAIGLFPAEKDRRHWRSHVSFCCVFFFFSSMWAALQNLCSTMKGIERDSATVCCKKAKGWYFTCKSQRQTPLILHSPQVTRDGSHYAGAVQTIEISCDVLYITRCSDKAGERKKKNRTAESVERKLLRWKIKCLIRLALYNVVADVIASDLKNICICVSVLLDVLYPLRISSPAMRMSSSNVLLNLQTLLCKMIHNFYSFAVLCSACFAGGDLLNYPPVLSVVLLLLAPSHSPRLQQSSFPTGIIKV